MYTSNHRVIANTRTLALTLARTKRGIGEGGERE